VSETNELALAAGAGGGTGAEASAFVLAAYVVFWTYTAEIGVTGAAAVVALVCLLMSLLVYCNPTLESLSCFFSSAMRISVS
jgi:hypothetical protein